MIAVPWLRWAGTDHSPTSPKIKRVVTKRLSPEGARGMLALVTAQEIPPVVFASNDLTDLAACADSIRRSHETRLRRRADRTGRPRRAVAQPGTTCGTSSLRQ